MYITQEATIFITDMPSESPPGEDEVATTIYLCRGVLVDVVFVKQPPVYHEGSPSSTVLVVSHLSQSTRSKVTPVCVCVCVCV